MTLLRYLKVLSVTVGAVAIVGSLVVFALVPRDALVEYFPPLQGILPPPKEKPQPVDAKEPVVKTAKKTETVLALPATSPEEAPPEKEEPLAQDEPEKSPELEKQPIEEKEVEVDLDDPDALEEIAESATSLDQLIVRRRRGVETVSDQGGPFTGWVKRIYSRNGQLEELGRYEHGLRDGLSVGWWWNGQKRMQGHYKNGQQNGVWTYWRSNGEIAKEYTYLNGKKSRDKIKFDQDARRLRWREMLEERERIRQERFPRK